ncbi:helix-turn-helix transcriptional regulator [Actinomadura sp. BRA 177]|uniref:helix-turn-helix domain-containing protein n=1 Tax=Actinomadura sp. BRA 177 TaxID=2745202 RepID=UPI001595AB98|nr:helix-turn-helix transcriptional regulator [Actinomadura sp. BRA 177]NVI91042.1 helix-turn-helix domain-containing protein [Actinomadura sp. BRA 177]
MTARRSPTVRKRRLAAELRRLRKQCGLTREQVAERIGCAPVTITRVETGQSGARVGEVSLMLEVYGVTGDEREALLQVAKDARKRGWWHPYNSTMPKWFQVYVGLEEEAAVILDYAPETIPGPLQVEDYIRAVSLAGLQPPREEELERRVALRVKRQERLTSDDAPKLWVVLNEGAIWRQVGGAETMRQQLSHLIEMSRLSHINILVLPFSAGAHPAMHGPCTVLRFPESADPDVVYIQYRRGSVYLEDPADIEHYVELFDQLRAIALSPDESRALIARAASEMSS